MARVTGPLHSDTASGSFAKSIVFGTWKGRAYARELVKPKNPKSAKQSGVRAMLGFLANAWATVISNSRTTWDAAAALKQISAFNEYCSANLKRWQNFQGPTQASPATEASTGLTISAHSFTGGIGQTALSYTVSGTTNLWGVAILRSTAEIVTPDWTQCIAIREHSTAGPHTYVDSPLTPDVYHYRLVAINTDGKLGTVLADDTAEAT